MHTFIILKMAQYNHNVFPQCTSWRDDLCGWPIVMKTIISYYVHLYVIQGCWFFDAKFS